MSLETTQNGGRTTPAVAVWAVLALVTVWAAWPALEDISGVWAEDPTYSHGYIVPLFSLWLLWMKRDELMRAPVRPSWWGVLVVCLGMASLYAGAMYTIRWLTGFAFVLFLLGGALVAGGWGLTRLMWPAIGFLVFMIPLPYRISTAMRSPLQRFASIASTFFMQMIGLPAIREGNVITVNEAQIGVAEACSGLKMLITFVALAVGMVLVIKRPLLDKLVILASAVPIAIISNIIRVTVTGILYVTVGGKVAEFVYHDLAGFLMMPLGVGLMWLELWVLEHLFVEKDTEVRVPLDPLMIPPVGLSGAGGKKKLGIPEI